jgi:DNA-directed RNA polymerase specialized sigma24 family protein
MTKRGFDLLMTAFASDLDEAGRKYERIRRSLLIFFRSRGGRDPESLADMTFDRVAGKLAEGAVITSDDPAHYILGVARFVLLESQKRPSAVPIEGSVEPRSPVPSVDEVSRERDDRCLQMCLQQVVPNQRELIVEYYVGREREKIDHREAIAARLGISVNALRIRMCRLRDQLRECVSKCGTEHENTP